MISTCSTATATAACASRFREHSVHRPWISGKFLLYTSPMHAARSFMYVFLLVLVCVGALSSKVAYAECRTVVWGSPEYTTLVSQGWGPVITFFRAPPPGTTTQLCSDWKSGITTPPPGPRQATPEELADLKALGIDSNLIDAGLIERLRGGCEASPYRILETEFKGSANVQITPVGSGASLSNGINPALACRLIKLLQAARQRGCNVKLISAYRSAQQQQGVCGAGRTGCAPAGKSCHQYGLAVDVSNQCIGWMRMVAPQFQLVFPYYGDHIQCAEHRVASCSPSTPPCNGSVSINPDLTTFPSPQSVPDTYYVPPAAGPAPSSGIADQIRSALGMTPPPPPPPPPPLPSPQPSTQQPAQPIQQSQQEPLQNAFQTIPATSSTSSISSLLTTINIGSNGTTSTSTIDILSNFVNPLTITSTDIGTSSPISLILSAINDIAAIGPDSAAATSSKASSTLTTQIVNSQQTFTSGNLGDFGTGVPQQTSTFLQALEGAKKVLLGMLEYLKPFRGFPQDDPNFHD